MPTGHGCQWACLIQTAQAAEAPADQPGAETGPWRQLQAALQGDIICSSTPRVLFDQLQIHLAWLPQPCPHLVHRNITEALSRVPLEHRPRWPSLTALLERERD